MRLYKLVERTGTKVAKVGVKYHVLNLSVGTSANFMDELGGIITTSRVVGFHEGGKNLVIWTKNTEYVFEEVNNEES